MTGTPNLSVVLPVLNAEPYIGQTLRSVVANLRPDIELIVIDDGSDDATPEIVAEAAPRLPGTRVITHEHAHGLADARNVGLAAAEGRFVTYLDGDDWLAPGYLPQLVDAIDRLGCDFVRVDHVQVEGRARATHWAPQGMRNTVLDPRESILPANRRSMVDYPYAWAGVYRRSLGDLLTFPSGLRTAEDRPWIWRLHRELRSYAVVSLAGLFYRRLVTTSLTQVGDERQLDFFRAYDQVLREVTADPQAARFLPKATRQFVAILGHHLTLLPRYERALAARFRARARSALAALPPEQLAGIVVRGERAAALRTVVPASSPLRAGLRR
ncbi:glycosyltransferase family 2 protein [uncultured Jatrophihabitans sp.]|uniref:glycosyltransferase family 2 protein n=1 Tax=uncultured Jatrophihabitans sp. TaxID=1610747 RepID=UPI0035CC854E